MVREVLTLSLCKGSVLRVASWSELEPESVERILSACGVGVSSTKRGARVICRDSVLEALRPRGTE